MTDCTGIDRSVMPLELEEFQAIFVGQRTGCDGMRAVMAAFTIEIAVPGGHAIQRLILIELTTVVAGIAARLVKPRLGIL